MAALTDKLLTGRNDMMLNPTDQLEKRICNAIEELNDEEGNSVEILAPNAEFDGPNYAIYFYHIHGGITRYSTRFTGNTLLEALDKAVKYKKAINR